MILMMTLVISQHDHDMMVPGQSAFIPPSQVPPRPLWILSMSFKLCAGKPVSYIHSPFLGLHSPFLERLASSNFAAASPGDAEPA